MCRHRLLLELTYKYHTCDDSINLSREHDGLPVGGGGNLIHLITPKRSYHQLHFIHRYSATAIIVLKYWVTGLSLALVLEPVLCKMSLLRKPS